jgi:hypothetical protein
MKPALKSWATPLAIGAFTISAVTGLLIFFHIEAGIVEPVHKWLSWLLVAGVLLHIAVNWRQFSGYFSKKPALAIIGTALVVTAGSLFPVFGDEDKEKGHGGAAAAKVLQDSSLEMVALVVKSNPKELVARLDKQGIKVTNPSLTIREIAGQNGKKGNIVLDAVLGKSAGKPDGDGDEH